MVKIRAGCEICAPDSGLSVCHLSWISWSMCSLSSLVPLAYPINGKAALLM
jgi:hypothetical protein